MIIGTLTLLTLFMVSPISLAEEKGITFQNESTPPEVGSNIGADDFLASIIKVILALIVIIGIFFLIIKLLSQKNARWFGNRSIKLLGGIQLGQNKSLQVMELGSSLYVIGVGENVKLIDKIDDPEEVILILDSFHQQDFSSNRGMFSVKEWFGKMNKTKQVNENSEMDEASFQNIFNSKIKTMSDRKKSIEQLLSENRQEER
jgi:flagellar protein FliO/FliZ